MTREALLCDETEKWKHGVHVVNIWRVRADTLLPLGVEATAALREVQILDTQHRSHDETVLRHAYALVILRTVNGVADHAQIGRCAASLNVIASHANIPKLLVDLRHSSTHNTLPTLKTLRYAAALTLTWLTEAYWARQLALLLGQVIVAHKYLTQPTKLSEDKLAGDYTLTKKIWSWGLYFAHREKKLPVASVSSATTFLNNQSARRGALGSAPVDIAYSSTKKQLEVSLQWSMHWSMHVARVAQQRATMHKHGANTIPDTWRACFEWKPCALGLLIDVK